MALDKIPEVGSGEIFHDNERRSLGFTDVVNHGQVFMGQSACGLGLSVEPIPDFRNLQSPFQDDFYGHFALDNGIIGLVDHPHAALTKFFQNLIFTDVLHQSNTICSFEY